MSQGEQVNRLELATIQPIPLDQRHGTYGDLFTVWFGSNLMLLTIVTGGLAVTLFALPFWWAVAGLAIGNLVEIVRDEVVAQFAHQCGGCHSSFFVRHVVAFLWSPLKTVMHQRLCFVTQRP